MKFLCPSCKAKYQIGDEKVAGRSVRMKCRKCGYVIQVSNVPGLGDALPGSEPPPADAMSDASAAEFPRDSLTPFFEPSSPVSAAGTPRPAPAAAKSAPTAASTPAAKSAPTAASAPAAKSGPTVAAAPSTASSPAAAQRPEVKKIPVVGTRPAAPKPAFAPLAAKAPVVAPAKAPVVAPAKGPPPKSSPQKPAAPSANAALGIKGESRPLQSAVGTPLPAVAPKPAVIADKRPFIEEEEEERTRIADVGALAGAFSLAVGGTSDAAGPDSLSMPADEWFVGINGVPVGPIRLSELRSKAASGSVNRESLVWRDGFEDWRPLGTFPELLAIVDESVSSARASLTPFTPSAGMIVGPVPGTAAAVAVPTVSSTDVEAYAGSGNGITGAAVVTDELEAAAGIPKRGGASPAAWIAVAMALMFGLTIGFVLFNKGNKTVEVVKYVDRVVPPGAASGALPVPDTSAAVSDGSNAPADPKNPVKRPTAPAKSSGTAATEPDKGISGLKGLQGLGSLGPGHGPDSSGPSGTAPGTGQLDGAQIQSTVARYTGSVKRACWQPALDTRDKDAPTTARVNVAITVLPSGSVSNAVVNGDPKGYRGLSQCISSRVRGWQFPPSGDTTTVNVPFVFAAQ
jgi:predicted Zn finger-like uncharacterized protein